MILQMKDASSGPNVDLVICKDGSHTLKLKDSDEHYHSTHGALEESRFVYLKNGLELFKNKPSLSILEVGFGTGMNALLSEIWAGSGISKINYTAYEPYPIAEDVWRSLNYPDLLGGGTPSVHSAFYECPWEMEVGISAHFRLLKLQQKIEVLDKTDSYDLIYFDAFGPETQPELWTKELFQKMFRACKKGAILVTYCAKGQVRRDLQEVGFEVERLSGPPAKRHMLRARKK